MLGANVEQMGGRIKAKADVLTGTDVVFDCVSVGATINVMLAAAKAHGTTIIYNAAKEPHVVDLSFWQVWHRSPIISPFIGETGRSFGFGVAPLSLPLPHCGREHP